MNENAQPSKSSGYIWLGVLLAVPGMVFLPEGGWVLVVLAALLILAGLIGTVVAPSAPEPKPVRPWH